MLADMPKFGECYIINATFIGSEETSSFRSVKFFSAFHWSPSIGKCPLTPVSHYPSSRLWNHMKFLWPPSASKPWYDSGILHQAYGIIRRLPMNLTRFADLVIIWVVHFLERMGLIIASDQTMRAVHIYYYSSGLNRIRVVRNMHHFNNIK